MGELEFWDRRRRRRRRSRCVTKASLVSFSVRTFRCFSKDRDEDNDDDDDDDDDDGGRTFNFQFLPLSSEGF